MRELVTFVVTRDRVGPTVTTVTVGDLALKTIPVQLGDYEPRDIRGHTAVSVILLNGIEEEELREYHRLLYSTLANCLLSVRGRFFELESEQ